MRVAATVLAILGVVAGAVAVPAHSGRERALQSAPYTREEKLHGVEALRFPALGSDAITASCFYNYPRKLTECVPEPPASSATGGPVWPSAPGGVAPPCPDPEATIDTTVPGLGGLSPHMACLNQINADFPYYLATYNAMETTMESAATVDARETRARSVIDLALSATVDKLRRLGHDGLIIDTEYSLGTSTGSHGTTLPIPTGDGGTENWPRGYPAGCAADISPLWGSADYIVRDTRQNNRIIMVVEAKRYKGIANPEEDQLIRGMLGAAAANYWGQRAAGGGAAAGDATAKLTSVSKPRPGATGGTSTVAGVLSDGNECHTIMLCGNHLNNDGIHRIPVASPAHFNYAGGADRFHGHESCFLLGLTSVLHGGGCK